MSMFGLGSRKKKTAKTKLSAKETEEQYDMFRSMVEKGYPRKTIETAMTKLGLDPNMVFNARTKVLRASHVETDDDWGEPPHRSPSPSRVTRLQNTNPLSRTASSRGNLDVVRTLRRTKTKRKVFIQNDRNASVTGSGLDVEAPPSPLQRVPSRNRSSLNSDVPPPVPPLPPYQSNLMRASRNDANNESRVRFQSQDASDMNMLPALNVSYHPNENWGQPEAPPRRSYAEQSYNESNNGYYGDHRSNNGYTDNRSQNEYNDHRSNNGYGDQRSYNGNTENRSNADNRGNLSYPDPPTLTRTPSYYDAPAPPPQLLSPRPGMSRMFRDYQNVPRTSFSEMPVDEFGRQSVTTETSRNRATNTMKPIRRPTRTGVFSPRQPTVPPPAASPDAFSSELFRTASKRKLRASQASSNVDSGSVPPGLVSPSIPQPQALNAIAPAFSTNPMFQHGKNGNVLSFQTENTTSSRTLLKPPSDPATPRPKSSRPKEDESKALGKDEVVAIRMKNGNALKLYAWDSPVHRRFKAMQIDGRDHRDVVNAMEAAGVDAKGLYKNLDDNRHESDPVAVNPIDHEWNLKYSKRYFQQYYQHTRTGEVLWKEDVDKLNGKMEPEPLRSPVAAFSESRMVDQPVPYPGRRNRPSSLLEMDNMELDDTEF